jgi:hypothetical protein
VWLGISYTRAFGNTVTQATKENQMVKIVSDEGKASTGQSVQGSSWPGLECRSTIMKSLFSTEPGGRRRVAALAGSSPYRLAERPQNKPAQAVEAFGVG